MYKKIKKKITPLERFEDDLQNTTDINCKNRHTPPNLLARCLHASFHSCTQALMHHMSTATFPPLSIIGSH